MTTTQLLEQINSRLSIVEKLNPRISNIEKEIARFKNRRNIIIDIYLTKEEVMRETGLSSTTINQLVWKGVIKKKKKSKLRKGKLYLKRDVDRLLGGEK